MTLFIHRRPAFAASISRPLFLNFRIPFKTSHSLILQTEFRSYSSILVKIPCLSITKLVMF